MGPSRKDKTHRYYHLLLHLLCYKLCAMRRVSKPHLVGVYHLLESTTSVGVLKELNPTMVATFSDKESAHEGHPFLVEAAVSLGGEKLREGINVFRYANRIPLLFEAGADVVTQV